MSALRGVAAWTGPALLVGLAARVFGGDAIAPVILLATVLAPLVALLRRSPGPRPDPVTAASAWVAAAAVLWAGLRTLGEASVLVGLPPAAGIVGGALVAVLIAFPGVPERPWLAGAAAAPLVLGALLGTAAAAAPAWPWQAWAMLASRPALAFAPASEWVTGGGLVVAATTFTVGEPQRIVVLTPGLYRVIERDAGQVAVREWRLGAGEALSLQSGDQFTAPAGSRLRFEAGKRVPGAARSGPAWAARHDRDPRRGLADAAGLALTLLGGALALVAPAGRAGAAGALVGPGLVLVATLTMAAWGVYAAAVAPDLLLGTPAAAGILRLPAVVAGAGGAPLLWLTLGAIAALFAGSVASARDRVAGLSGLGAWGAAGAWSALVVAAALATTAPLDTWRGLLLGLGLAACGSLGPGGHPALRARLAGALVAGAAFAGLAVAAPWLERSWAPLASAPVLAAVPVGLLAARVAGRRRR